MPARKLLLGLLVVSLVIEIAYPVLGFFAPQIALDIFKVQSTPDILFFTHIIAWCLLFVALVIALALHWVIRGEPRGFDLCILLGIWWVGIGMALWIGYGKIENFFLDAVKGALLAAFAWRARGAKIAHK